MYIHIPENLTTIQNNTKNAPFPTNFTAPVGQLNKIGPVYNDCSGSLPQNKLEMESMKKINRDCWKLPLPKWPWWNKENLQVFKEEPDNLESLWFMLFLLFIICLLLYMFAAGLHQNLFLKHRYNLGKKYAGDKEQRKSFREECLTLRQILELPPKQRDIYLEYAQLQFEKEYNITHALYLKKHEKTLEDIRMEARLERESSHKWIKKITEKKMKLLHFNMFVKHIGKKNTIIEDMC
ncbi:uncharacterized protein SCDLUD_001456 [Saccharomycodes ludwigii]|uniref:uncharacterized protein n=1 Tax=Saccharomycodes ludwigii TaxID=36035 RepID=UPI001E88EF0D|nr:hypothetical protein SCDLUD_001456 [Saccharomycodes ludwigii]KAH3901685.1 hypothetical protein SCDLUD_001456 [Saccharomycodes ludwigii]